MQRNLLFITSVLAVTLLCCGCSSSLDDMTGDYTGTHKATTVTVSNDYTVDTVEGEDMLRESYAVSYRTTLCLTAPSGATRYEWIAEVGENANGDTVGDKILLSEDQNLIVYIPESKLKRWSDYTLTLTVTKPSGLTYTDKATLSIY